MYLTYAYLATEQEQNRTEQTEQSRAAMDEQLRI